jgi:hypothetical protein
MVSLTAGYFNIIAFQFKFQNCLKSNLKRAPWDCGLSENIDLDFGRIFSVLVLGLQNVLAGQGPEILRKKDLR